MQIRRLGLAGLQLTSGETSLVIDYFTSLGSLADYVSEPGDLVTAEPAQLALVTHLHRDHTDVDAIRSVLRPRGRVLRPARHSGEGLESIACAEAEHALAGVPQQVMREWQTVTEGPFTITAVPAVDGFGDPQVSWVVEADGTRILHAGDTLFHGSWWLIAMRCGPVDVAFLPVNGAVCDFPHRQPGSPLPACMGPTEAATAAHLLQARLAVPIHYGLHHPPVYSEVDRPAEAFVEAAHAAGIEAQIAAPGEEVSALAPAA
jgi:L-ascorbate metabolism protein UlaG (beta-lactamase superfamily)